MGGFLGSKKKDFSSGPKIKVVDFFSIHPTSQSAHQGDSSLRT